MLNPFFSTAARSAVARLKALAGTAVLLGAIGAIPGQAVADVAEFNECSSWMSVPYSILIKREPQGWLPGDVTRRTETYYDNSVRSLHKNPETYDPHGPLHGRNCTVNFMYWGTQTLQFRLKTANYFGTAANPTAGVASHLAILMRGNVVRTNNADTPASQQGRGLAIYKTSQGGVHVENFTTGAVARYNGSLVMEDGKWYSILMHTHYHGIGYTVTDDATGLVMSDYYEDPSPYTLGQGYGFGVLCSDANGACLNVPQFEVLIQDIQTNWFQ